MCCLAGLPFIFFCSLRMCVCVCVCVCVVWSFSRIFFFPFFLFFLFLVDKGNRLYKCSFSDLCLPIIVIQQCAELNLKCRSSDFCHCL